MNYQSMPRNKRIAILFIIIVPTIVFFLGLSSANNYSPNSRNLFTNMVSDMDGMYRTVQYYENSSHQLEMINKIKECRQTPQTQVGYENCKNAEMARKRGNNETEEY